MWKRIKDTQYFLEFSQNCGYEIFVTDYLSVWTTRFSEKEFIAQLKFFRKVTRTLLNIICDLRESQAELRRLLIKKDSEIEEYKCEGGEIVLRHLKTIAYNDVEHMKKHKVFEENFGVSSTSANLFEEALAIVEKNVLIQEPDPEPSIKTEPVPVIKTEPGLSIKTEPDTTVTDSIPSVKLEPKTEVAEETNAPAITASVSCKQEIKREHARAHVPRKRSKFNF